MRRCRAGAYSMNSRQYRGQQPRQWYSPHPSSEARHTCDKSSNVVQRSAYEIAVSHWETRRVTRLSEWPPSLYLTQSVTSQSGSLARRIWLWPASTAHTTWNGTRHSMSTHTHTHITSQRLEPISHHTRGLQPRLQPECLRRLTQPLTWPPTVRTHQTGAKFSSAAWRRRSQSVWRARPDA